MKRGAAQGTSGDGGRFLLGKSRSFERGREARKDSSSVSWINMEARNWKEENQGRCSIK